MRVELRKILPAVGVAIAALMIVACGGGGSASAPGGPAPQPTPNPTPTPTQERISVADLTGAATPGLVAMSQMARPHDALAPFITFSGRLNFSQTPILANFVEEFDNSYGTLKFPAFSIQLVSDGDDLIPIQRDLISAWGSGSSYWDVIVGAGKIWAQTGDDNWHRASIPITLASRRTGQLRNCVALFLYTLTQTSKTYVQCSQESSPVDAFHPGDMRALVPLVYTPGAVANAAQSVADYRSEVMDDIPVAPWKDIDDAGDNVKKTFNANMVPEHVQSFGGLLIDGVIYQQTPLTRRGAYPYPREMRYGVFSVTKTLGAGLSMLYLAQRYGDGVFDELITDYVPGLATHPGWQGVTFEHTLNMVTGLATNDSYQYILPFQDATSANQAIAVIAGFPDAAPAPGATFLYASAHTFVLSYAMQQYVKAHEGANAHYWDMVVEDVLTPIGIRHFAIQKTLEAGGAKGIPTLGWGAFIRADDAAKLATLFANEGEFNGMQLLHRQRTREATNKTAFNGQYVSADTRYQHSFWQRDIPVGTCTVEASYMEGHGGNFIALLPSGVTILRFTDNVDRNLPQLVRAAEMVRTSC